MILTCHRIEYDVASLQNMQDLYNSCIPNAYHGMNGCTVIYSICCIEAVAIIPSSGVGTLGWRMQQCMQAR